MFWLWFIPTYLACGLIAWCLMLGFFTHKFPYFNNTDAAILGLLTGIPGLIATIIFCTTEGLDGWHWRFLPMSREERFRAFKAHFFQDTGLSPETRERLAIEHFTQYENLQTGINR